MSGTLFRRLALQAAAAGLILWLVLALMEAHGLRIGVIFGALAAVGLALLAASYWSRRSEEWAQDALAAAVRMWLNAPQSEADGFGLDDPALAAFLEPLNELRQTADQHALAAQRLEAVLEGLDTAVVAVDGQRRLVYANSAAGQVFHLGEVPLRGHRLTTLPRIPQLQQWAERVITTNRPVSGRIHLSDERMLQAYVSPFASHPPGFVVLARDITDTVRLENSRKDFIAGVSHELRTPLTSIQGYAEMLRDADDLSAKQREFLDVILANTERLSRLARDLVTLSSIETGTYPFHYRAVEAGSLVEPALAVMRPLAQARDCQIAVKPFEPGPLHADPDALHRVLLNLIENAIQHGGREGGVKVTLAGRRIAGLYEIEVQDTGIGISSSDQPRVFERFYRVDKSHSRPGGGTGLGLALVKHIVREHGGQVELESRLGEGCSFRLVLPLAKPAAQGVAESNEVVKMA